MLDVILTVAIVLVCCYLIMRGVLDIVKDWWCKNEY